MAQVQWGQHTVLEEYIKSQITQKVGWRKAFKVFLDGQGKRQLAKEITTKRILSKTRKLNF